jgi:uncharacterized protein YxjI
VTGVVVACPCGEVYELKPQYAGRLLECAVCSRTLRAPGTVEPIRRPAPDIDPAFDRDVFLLRERLLSVRAKYEVWDEAGVPVCFVERPTYPVRTVLAYMLAFIAAGFVFERLLSWGPAGLAELVALALAGIVLFVIATSARPKRHVTIYRNESRREVLLRIRQDQRVVLITRTYTVISVSGAVLARLRKHYLHNLVRKRWDVEAPDGRPVAVAVEDSIVLSLLRRVLGPLFGLLRTNFIVLSAGAGAGDGVVIGEFNRKLTLLDRYVLDLRGDRDRRLDRRVALALGIMLDTGERR